MRHGTRYKGSMRVAEAENGVEPVYWSDEVNPDILLYRGGIELAHDDSTLSGAGLIVFQSLPTPRIRLIFSSEVPGRIQQLDQFFDAPARDLRINLLDAVGEVPSRVDEGALTADEQEALQHGEQVASSRGSGERVSLSRTVDAVEVFPGSLVNYAVFNVMNFPGARYADRKASFSLGGWLITLHDRIRPDLMKTLRRNSGFAFTTACRVERSDGKQFNPEKIEKVLSVLWNALSFAKGHLVCRTLLTGFDASNKQVYAKWSATPADPWRYCLSWYDRDNLDGVAQIADYLLTADDEVCEITKYWIRFYLAGNNPSPVDPSHMMVLAGLESISWWTLYRRGDWLIEKKDAEALSAAARIRLFLKFAHIPTGIPQNFEELSGLSIRHEGAGGPELVTRARNAITHTTDLNRLFGFDALMEAWRLATWYLELGILFVCGYSGPTYANRLLLDRYDYELSTLPWISDPVE